MQKKHQDVREGWKKPLEDAKAALTDAVARVTNSTANKMLAAPFVLVRKGGRPKKAENSKITDRTAK